MAARTMRYGTTERADKIVARIGIFSTEFSIFEGKTLS
jgi:hypothetical protein